MELERQSSNCFKSFFCLGNKDGIGDNRTVCIQGKYSRSFFFFSGFKMVQFCNFNESDKIKWTKDSCLDDASKICHPCRNLPFLTIPDWHVWRADCCNNVSLHTARQQRTYPVTFHLGISRWTDVN